MMSLDRNLHQRLEALRLRGARQRLEVTLALDAFAQQTAGLRGGGAWLGAAMRWLWARSPDPQTSSAGTSGRSIGGAAAVLALVASVFGSARHARRLARVRTALDLGALALLLYRHWRRRRQEPASDSAP